MIGIALDSEVVEAGRFVTGTVHWSAESMRRIGVMLEWRTDGKGNYASGIARAAAFPAATREGSLKFRLKIPFEGPISFEGVLIQVAWQVRAHADRAGIDESQSAPFRVVVRKRT